MSESNDKGDVASYKSILEGVRRMRESYDVGQSLTSGRSRPDKGSVRADSQEVTSNGAENAPISDPAVTNPSHSLDGLGSSIGDGTSEVRSNKRTRFLSSDLDLMDDRNVIQGDPDHSGLRSSGTSNSSNIHASATRVAERPRQSISSHLSGTPGVNGTTETSASSVPLPRPLAANAPVSTHTKVQVNRAQQGNPMLNPNSKSSFLWEFNHNVLSDYYINPTLQILFLSLKYHKLRPEYIWGRIRKLNKGLSSSVDTSSSRQRKSQSPIPSGEGASSSRVFQSYSSSSSLSDRSLRILLVVVDVDTNQEIIRALTNICMKHDLSLLLAWSFEEAATYVNLAKQQELSASKQSTTIKKAKEEDYESRIRDTLVSIRAVNKTDATNLLANLKSFENIVRESVASKPGSSLGQISGLGKKKLDNMKHIFSEPFIYNKEYD